MTPQDEIKQILFNNDKTKVWLANKLGMSKSDLTYQLNRATNFSVDLYNRVMDIFRKENFITKDDQCDFLIRQTLQIDAVIGHSLTMLNDNVLKFTKDNVLDFKEKSRLIEVVTKIKDELIAELETIEKIIES
jgi:hypothetical protein